MNSTWYEEAKAKTIMIVGPSPPSKIFPFEIARKLNLSVVVAHWENSWAQKYADVCTLKFYFVFKEIMCL